MTQLAYRRILLNLSGEAVIGDEDYGIDPKVIGRLSRDVVQAQQAGAAVALVAGGGHPFRGGVWGGRGGWVVRDADRGHGRGTVLLPRR